MPLWWPQRDAVYRTATGGLGLESVQALPAILFQTQSRAEMIELGMLPGTETWRISSGETAFFDIPQNETVIILDMLASPTEGLMEVEQETLDVTGKGLVEEASVTKAATVGGLKEGELYGAAGRLAEGSIDDTTVGVGELRTQSAWSDEWGGVVTWDVYWTGSEWLPVPW